MTVEGSVFLTQPEFNPFAKKRACSFCCCSVAGRPLTEFLVASFWIGRRRVYPTRYELERHFLAGRMLLHGLLAMAARGSGITGANQTQPRRWMILCLIRVFAVENRSLKLQPGIHSHQQCR